MKTPFTQAKDFRLVANPGCFDIELISPFTLRNMNPMQNYHRHIRNRKSLWDLCIRERFSPTKLLLKTLSEKTFSELAPSFGFQTFCQEFQLSKSVKKSQNTISKITVVLHVFSILKENSFGLPTQKYISGITSTRPRFLLGIKEAHISLLPEDSPLVRSKLQC